MKSQGITLVIAMHPEGKLDSNQAKRCPDISIVTTNVTLLVMHRKVMGSRV